MTTPNSHADPDNQPDAGAPEEQIKADNKVIDRLVMAWVALGVLAFIVMAVT